MAIVLRVVPTVADPTSATKKKTIHARNNWWDPPARRDDEVCPSVSSQTHALTSSPPISRGVPLFVCSTTTSTTACVCDGIGVGSPPRTIVLQSIQRTP